jgi:predicted nuclease of restriction endonuclease-like RecB superfamily
LPIKRLEESKETKKLIKTIAQVFIKRCFSIKSSLIASSLRLFEHGLKIVDDDRHKEKELV